MVYVIGLSALAGHGKDTLADYVIAQNKNAKGINKKSNSNLKEASSKQHPLQEPTMSRDRYEKCRDRAIDAMFQMFYNGESSLILAASYASFKERAKEATDKCLYANDCFENMSATSLASCAAMQKMALANRLKVWSRELLEIVYGVRYQVSDFQELSLKEQTRQPFRFRNEPMTIRRVLQYLGTEIGRTHFGDDIWVKLLVHDIYRDVDLQLMFVCDVRFQNELDFLRSEFQDEFYSLKIVRNCKNNDNNSQSQPLTAVHTSEQWISKLDCDETITNDGSLDEYFEKIKLWMSNVDRFKHISC